MTTATLTITNIWITDVASSVSVVAASPTRDLTAALSGSIRFYAGGRARVITTPADLVTYPLALQLVSDTDAALLIAWRGQVLLLRDALGRRVFGTYLQVDLSDVTQGAEFWHNVSLSFTQIDYDESV
jgi:hypothetical protein